MKRFYLFLSILFLTIFMSSCSNDPSNPSPEEGYSKLIIKAEKGAVLCGFLDAAEIGSSEH